MLAEAHRQATEDIEKTMTPPPSWLDNETRALIQDVIGILAERHSNLVAVILYGSVARHEQRPLDTRNPSDVDLLVILDSDDPHIAIHQGDVLFHTLGLDAPREVQVQFSSRTLQEWDPTFIANVLRDGIVLYARGSLPAPFAA
jgi:predicted nucleotidyltransferase